MKTGFNLKTNFTFINLILKQFLNFDAMFFFTALEVNSTAKIVCNFTGKIKKFFFFYFPKTYFVHTFLSSFKMKIRDFFMKTLKSGWLFYLIVPRDVTNFCWVSEVGNFGQRAVKNVTKEKQNYCYGYCS